MDKNYFAKKTLPMALAAIMAVSPAQVVLAASNDLDGHWAKAVITQWQDTGLIKGYADGTFKPNNSITRAEFVTIMNNALGFTDAKEISFTDVKLGDWYFDAVAKAAAAGYSKGYEDGSFKPNATITRAEAAVMIANAAGLEADETGAADFTDAYAIPGWAKGSIGAVVEAGFMSGYPDGSFGAAKSITRAEAVSSLNRVMGGFEVTEEETEDIEDVTEEEKQTEEDKKTEEDKQTTGGGSSGSSGGSKKPINKVGIESAEALQAAIEAGKSGKKLNITLDENALLNADVEAVFAGKELTIDFKNVDMKANKLSIDAPNATKITLKDSAEAASGTEIGTLEINAPNADVESDLQVETVNIIAVKDGTFKAKDIVKVIEILKGALEVLSGAETTVTIPETATAPVKVKGTVKEIEVKTEEPVTVDAAVKKVKVDKKGAEVKGKGKIEKIEAAQDATISAENVTEVEIGSGVTAIIAADVKNITIPKDVAEAPTIKVEAGKKVDNVTAGASVNVTGSGTIVNVDAVTEDGKKIEIVAPEDSEITVESIVNAGSGTVEIRNESISDKAELPEVKTVKSIKLNTEKAKTVYYAGDEIDRTGIFITPKYNDDTTAEAFEAKGNAAVTISPEVAELDIDTVTVTYAGTSAEFTITVLDAYELKELVKDAKAELAYGYSISEKYGHDVPTDKMWVTKEMQTALTQALTAAEKVFTTQAEIDNAVAELETALNNFKPEYGSMPTETQTAEILALAAENLKAAEAVELLMAGVKAGDSIALPKRIVADLYGTWGPSITWKSSNTDVIEVGALDENTATYPLTIKSVEKDTEVTLTATISIRLTEGMQPKTTTVEIKTVVKAEENEENEETSALAVREWNKDIMIDGFNDEEGVVYSIEQNGTAVISSGSTTFTGLLYGADQSKYPITNASLVAAKDEEELGRIDNLVDITMSSEKIEYSFDTDGTVVIENPLEGSYYYKITENGTICKEGRIVYKNGAWNPDFTHPVLTDGQTIGIMHIDAVLTDNHITAEVTYSDDKTYVTEEIVQTSIEINANDGIISLSWDAYDGVTDYTWALHDSEGDIVEVQYENSNEVYDITAVLPRIDNGTETYTLVLYEQDKNDKDWIGRELERLENALTVTTEGFAIPFALNVTDPEKGEYNVTFEEQPEAGDIFVTRWKVQQNGKTRRYASAFTSDGDVTHTDKTFWGALNDGDTYYLRKVSYAMEGDVLNVTMTPASEATYTAENTSETTGAEFTLCMEDDNFYLTWEDLGYDEYQVRIYDGDTKIWSTATTTECRWDYINHFVPTTEENKSLAIVLKGIKGDEWYDLERLENAMQVTVLEESVPYEMTFNTPADGKHTLTWTGEQPEGVNMIDTHWRGEDRVMGGGGSITSTHQLNAALEDGDVYEIAVVKFCELDGQVMKATITTPYKVTYTA